MAEEPSALARSCDRIAWAIERVLAVGLIVAILFNVMNVVGRYITGFTLTGIDELEIYLLIWIAFLNAAVVSWRREHLRMDLIIKVLPGPMRGVVQAFEVLILLTVTSFVAYQSFLYVQRIFRLGAVSDMARVPTWIAHSAVFVGFVLMALTALYRGIAFFWRASRGTTLTNGLS